MKVNFVVSSGLSFIPASKEDIRYKQENHEGLGEEGKGVHVGEPATCPSCARLHGRIKDLLKVAKLEQEQINAWKGGHGWEGKGVHAGEVKRVHVEERKRVHVGEVHVGGGNGVHVGEPATCPSCSYFHGRIKDLLGRIVELEQELHSRKILKLFTIVSITLGGDLLI